MKGWSCVQGQGDSFMSEKEGGGEVMLFLHGTPLVMTSMCVSGYEERRSERQESRGETD